VGSAAGDHYFSPAPAARSRPTSVDLVLPDLSLTLLTDRGTFSPDAIDPGTKLLLLDGARPDETETGALLDLGCGYGPIACTVARRAPAARVWAVDVNERARRLCAANADAAGVDNVTVAAPADVPADVTFAGIWSNPPIRIGKVELHEVLSTWFSRLAPGGRAHLVVHKHLGADSLARWLDGEGWSTERRASRAGYRLLDIARR
jgi:16S rRNA (guanine1207-N2)-methyltransferase